VCLTTCPSPHARLVLNLLRDPNSSEIGFVFLAQSNKVEVKCRREVRGTRTDAIP
jgi:hypothetical protein